MTGPGSDTSYVSNPAPSYVSNTPSYDPTASSPAANYAANYVSPQASPPAGAAAPHPDDYVSGEQYRYALTNFVRTSVQNHIIYISTDFPSDTPYGIVFVFVFAQAIAHKKVEEQRSQLEEQERQIARLQARIATLEGTSSISLSVAGARAAGGSSVDDFSIKVRPFITNTLMLS